MSQMIALVLQSTANFLDTFCRKHGAFTNQHNQSINMSKSLWIVQNPSLVFINAEADIFWFNLHSLIPFKMQRALAGGIT